MKKLLITLLLFVACTISLSTITAQIMPPVQYAIYVNPYNPTATDSVNIIFTYVSGDSCPDYYLVKDSTVSNRIYVGKKGIENTDIACAQVVTKFSTTLKLGILPDNSQVYFEGALIKTIHYPCIMDKSGVVVAGSGSCLGRLFIEEITPYASAYPRLYVIQNNVIPLPNGTMQPGLKKGDQVKYGGYLTAKDSVDINECHTIGVATCYEIVQPPSGCVMDKKGVVVNCGGKLYIQEYSPVNSYPVLYTFNTKDSIVNNRVLTTFLKVGDNVIFGGTPVKFDSIMTSQCRVSGITTCYEVVIPPPSVCIMDKVGIVIEFKDNSSIVKESLTGDIYSIPNVKLVTGTQIKFKGTKIECFTTPCYNLIDCYQIVENPPCIMDKTGVVVAGIDGCTGRLFIQDTSSPTIQLYSIASYGTVNDTIGKGLKAGDKVRFGGYLIKNDSLQSILCSVVGVATCYEVIVTPPECVMDKMGVVVEVKDNNSFVKEKITGDSYVIHALMIVGTEIKFKGIKIECVTTPCYNIVECYHIIATPPCIMDKTGVVVAGIDGCTGRLFIQDASSTIIQLYAIGSSDIGNDTLGKGLKAGDKVRFGEYLIKNDSLQSILCSVVGVATCYEVIITPPECVMDKVGVVVECNGQLFIEESTPYMSMIRRLYAIKNIVPLNSTITIGLKVGDQVKFGGYLTPNDSSTIQPCQIIGIATCFGLISPENIHTLSGSALAGSEVMKSGLAVLFRKGDVKATSSFTITDGTFKFMNLPKADYTVYVIPAITIYKNYLPTFYINNFLFQNADYLTLSDSIQDMTVHLKQFDFAHGTGKITGNIFFESYALKDSILAVNSGLVKTSHPPMDNSAIDIPVLLLNRYSVPVAWTITDEYGNYTFENIALDTYKVVAETAAAMGESVVILTPGNSTANADLLLKSTQTETGTVNLKNEAFDIYPNPVTDHLIITMKSGEMISLYNSMGQLRLNQRLNAGINVLDVSTLNKGVYFAKIGKTTMKVIKK